MLHIYQYPYLSRMYIEIAVLSSDKNHDSYFMIILMKDLGYVRGNIQFKYKILYNFNNFILRVSIILFINA